MKKINVEDNSWMSVIVFILAILVFGVPALSWKWYRSGVQAAVYEREGIEMTQWEVFIGSVPAERTVNIQERGSAK